MIIRIEQLYPFPENALRDCLKKYSHLQKVTWVQEEAKNYGAWSFISEHFRLYFPDIKLDYTGREEKASSATGSSRQHKAEQEKLMEDVFT